MWAEYARFALPILSYKAIFGPRIYSILIN